MNDPNKNQQPVPIIAPLLSKHLLSSFARAFAAPLKRKKDRPTGFLSIATATLLFTALLALPHCSSNGGGGGGGGGSGGGGDDDDLLPVPAFACKRSVLEEIIAAP